MIQLKLNNKELREIGFKKCKSKSDEMNAARTYFKIETINGYFYYNPKEIKCTWYHKVIVGDLSNHTQLNISKKQELFILLSCFKSNFNLVF
jgi:hypothetical protein